MDSDLQRREQGLRLVRRMRPLRILGIGLGGICIGTVLWTDGARDVASAAGGAQWIALALSSLAWPHLAYRLGMRARDPYRAELRSLMADSALGGAWIAAMGFNLLPSMVIVAMLSMDKLAIGGVKFLARCSAVLVAACAAAALATGFEFRPETSMLQIAGSLPLLMVYPLLIGIANHRLARRVREDNLLLTEISRTDALTRLLNRGFWEAAVSAEFQRCKRAARPASLLMIDIDHFKAVNDRHGHPAGDEVIRAVAAILRNTLREQDLPGRYGGEEFGVVLPETTAAGAEVLAERLRQLIATSVLERNVGVRTTVSIGVAVFEAGIADFAEWISRADRALYAAKRRGRDRIEHFDPAADAPPV